MAERKERPADPASMSLEELERELRDLVEHEERLSSLPPCRRDRCDGRPHQGAWYAHEPRTKVGADPIEEAQMLDDGYRVRDHLAYMSERLAKAVEDVENGISRKLKISMPPRMGKSYQVSTYTPTWLIHKHPEWRIGLISHSSDLAVGWGRQVRRMVEDNYDLLGVEIAADAGAVANWETTAGGAVRSRSVGQSIIGHGFKVMIIDDPVKGFAEAHSEHDRERLWNWFSTDATSRLEPPSLVIVVGTRWHEDDMIGRLDNPEYGDPSEWETIRFPAIAEEDDVLGREPGDPLYSPLIPNETREQALDRWNKLRRAVGSYSWASMFQQRPAPAEGAIFDMGAWRYWTSNPSNAKEDGTVVYLDPARDLAGARWLDSWDMSYKGSDTSDYVVGQRWARKGPNRYLIAQTRGRRGFTETLAELRRWRAPESNPVTNPYGNFVHETVIEEAANGTAIMDAIKNEISGVLGETPVGSKEARARAVTPEIESHHVYLPYPGDEGNEWVTKDLLPELREFPHGTHDDQVDSLTQALRRLHDPGKARATVPRGTYRRGSPLSGRYGGAASARIPGR